MAHLFFIVSVFNQGYSSKIYMGGGGGGGVKSIGGGGGGGGGGGRRFHIWIAYALKEKKSHIPYSLILFFSAIAYS